MHRLSHLIIAASMMLFVQPVYSQESKTILGPSNLDLADGAKELLAGNGEEGVRLTLRGLAHATGQFERQSGLSNLCAGYIMLDQLDLAVSYCDKVLAENSQHWRALCNRALAYITLGRYEEAEQDLIAAEAIAPNSRNLQTVRGMLLDETNPVAPNITIDERRQPARDE